MMHKPQPRWGEGNKACARIHFPVHCISVKDGYSPDLHQYVAIRRANNTYGIVLHARLAAWPVGLMVNLQGTPLPATIGITRRQVQQTQPNVRRATHARHPYQGDAAFLNGVQSELTELLNLS